MSGESFEEWLLSIAESPPGDEFKWGWNAQTGEATVWQVGRHGDSRPFHRDFLREAWGREPTTAGGDRLGSALVPDATGDDPAKPPILIRTYYSKEAPEPVLHWFRGHFPDRAIA